MTAKEYALNKGMWVGIFLCLFLGASAGCASNQKNLEIAKEYPVAHQADQYQKLVELGVDLIKERDRPGHYLRDAHPKHHACLKAEFSITPGLPEELRVGIFRNDRTYPAWIRYSNGSGPKPDYEKDVRGMAIKLMEVEGEKLLPDEKMAKTQDFLLINNNVLVVKDAESFAELMDASMHGSSVLYFFNPFDSHLKEFGIYRDTFKVYPDVLDIRYWSAVPYLFGHGNAVKYAVKTCATPINRDMPVKPSKDYLREVISERLKSEGVCLDFMVQFQVGANRMLIEDARSDWDEAVSPFRKVATINIPVQSFESEKQMALCENISFTPWHALPEHRPLGDINRARKEVYRALSLFRHNENKTPRREPVGTDDYLEYQSGVP